MAALITYEDALSELQLEGLDGGPIEQQIRRKMSQATAIVINYIKRPNHGWTAATDPDTDLEFNQVQAAILATLVWLWRDRGDEEVDARIEEWHAVTLPPRIRQLLVGLRDPALR